MEVRGRKQVGACAACCGAHSGCEHRRWGAPWRRSSTSNSPAFTTYSSLAPSPVSPSLIRISPACTPHVLCVASAGHLLSLASFYMAPRVTCGGSRAVMSRNTWTRMARLHASVNTLAGTQPTTPIGAACRATNPCFFRTPAGGRAAAAETCPGEHRPCAPALSAHTCPPPGAAAAPALACRRAAASPGMPAAQRARLTPCHLGDRHVTDPAVSAGVRYGNLAARHGTVCADQASTPWLTGKDYFTRWIKAAGSRAPAAFIYQGDAIRGCEAGHLG